VSAKINRFATRQLRLMIGYGIIRF
jgi:hypothetical protein